MHEAMKQARNGTRDAPWCPCIHHVRSFHHHHVVIPRCLRRRNLHLRVDALASSVHAWHHDVPCHANVTIPRSSPRPACVLRGVVSPHTTRGEYNGHNRHWWRWNVAIRHRRTWNVASCCAHPLFVRPTEPSWRRDSRLERLVACGADGALQKVETKDERRARHQRWRENTWSSRWKGATDDVNPCHEDRGPSQNGRESLRWTRMTEASSNAVAREGRVRRSRSKAPDAPDAPALFARQTETWHRKSIREESTTTCAMKLDPWWSEVHVWVQWYAKTIVPLSCLQ